MNTQPVQTIHVEVHRLAAVPLPETAPVYGEAGPLREHWTKA